MTDIASRKETPSSRAVLRRVEPGNLTLCTACGEQMRFTAKEARAQVIANVYVDGRWTRVEHYHDGCYETADHPHGEPA